jgi:signal transduction histidine kinase
MKRLLPQTLLGQTLVVLMLGIGLSIAAAAWVWSSARQEAVRAVGALAAAERIVNVSRLVSEAPAAWRQRLIEGASDRSFQVAMAADRPVLPSGGDSGEAAGVIARFIREELPGRTVVVGVASEPARPEGIIPWGPGGGGWGRGMGHGAMHDGPGGPMRGGYRAALSWRSMTADVQLPDGPWLSFRTSLPDTGPTMSPRLLVALGILAGMIGLLTAWAARRLTAPLAVLSEAATRLGRDVGAPPLALTGSVEMRRAAEAFNGMQVRLRRLVENRTLMLASISHDLRTQLTLLRLRVEAGDLGEEPGRLLKTIAEMEEMLTATLSFAREEGQSEESRRVDVSALVDSIVDDMSDAGLPVLVGKIDRPAILTCKPVALRRAIVNLVDNGVKYGGKATVGLGVTVDHVEIMIDDEGPGIPEHELGRVMQPFYRLEDSRNRETGGIGLGLAIAASIVEAHGGELVLANRADGGLRARILLAH